MNLYSSISISSSRTHAHAQTQIRRFLANVTSRVYVRYMLSPVCLSVTFVHPTQPIEIFGNVSCHLIRRPSVDIQVKFYGDGPRGTPPSGELNTRGVAECSDFGPIERCNRVSD